MTGFTGAETGQVSGAAWGRRALHVFGIASGFAAAVTMAHPARSFADEKQGVAALLATVAQDCHAVALEAWRHPTKKILHDHDVELIALQLCNGNHYPVYTVRFISDPMGNNDTFFRPFYAKMAEANGFWPFAFVDLNDNEVVWIESKPGVREIKIDYDEYSPP